jgi:hypothetical protein
MLRKTLPAAALLAALSGQASANDGFGGLSATGLQFDKTGEVQMLSEDLFISLKTIRVAYVFRHLGSADVTGEIIFPLPPVNLASLAESDFAIDRAALARDNFVNFTATVDGKAVAVKTDRIAIIEPPYDENRPVSAAYNSPGRDVTEALEAYGVPVSLDTAAVQRGLDGLTGPAKADLARQEIVYLDGEVALPAWSVVTRFHWTQTFPAGRDVAIAHSYDGAFPGGIFGWSAESEPDSWQAQLVKKYCIDTGTQAAIKKALTPGEDRTYWTGMAHYVDYVLTTANTWAGPIGSFKLTLDKGDPKNLISLCIDGIRKTGPTTFVVEKKEFTPQRDLSVLLVQGVDTSAQ